jgi:hypothetical protein
VSLTRLRFVVGREHVRLVLALERLGLLGRWVKQAGTLADRLSVCVKHERQLAAGPAAGQDTATVDIAAELDLRLLDYASMMSGSESPAADRTIGWRPLALAQLIVRRSCPLA